MKYRKFGDLGFDVSALGLGCMRFPKTKDGKIDEPKSIEMMRFAIDNGINYFDTAYVYGDSELVVGKGLKDGYREKIKLATKIPPNRFEDFDVCLDEQLKRLQVDYIDFYLLHNMNEGSWKKAKDNNLLEALDKAKKDGRIKFAAFSFHDKFSVFKEIVDSYDWDMCQIQLNYLDENFQAGLEGLKYAASKGIPVVIMEPLKGGSLVDNIPEEVKKIFDSVGKSLVYWAFKWLYNFPEATTILSGMSNMNQLKENIEIFDEAEAGSMSEEELEVIEKVKEVYKGKSKVGCTGCNYCMPCPSGVAIPRIFKIYNDVGIGGSIDYAKNVYGNLVETKSDASQCTECGKCEEACPQNLTIIKDLKEAHAVLKR
jgi:uncharacterized protein